MGLPGTGADKVRDTERPEGTVDEDANPPLTDPTKTEVDRNTEQIPPQDTGHAVPLQGTYLKRRLRAEGS
jgi:hypothetical protein